MAKVTSKLQVTIPKVVADEYGIRPGDEVDWVPAGDVIRVVPVRQRVVRGEDTEGRLRLFDEATARQRKRQRSSRRKARKDRGWTREDLYR
jgi:AbrB family looped-hinge helix DNA binding protein